MGQLSGSRRTLSPYKVGRPDGFLFMPTTTQVPFLKGGSFRPHRLFPALDFVAAAFLLTAGLATAQSSFSLPSAPQPASNNGETVSRPTIFSDLKLAKAESLTKKEQLDEAEIVVREDLKIAPDSAAARKFVGRPRLLECGFSQEAP